MIDVDPKFAGSGRALRRRQRRRAIGRLIALGLAGAVALSLVAFLGFYVLGQGTSDTVPTETADTDGDESLSLVQTEASDEGRIELRAAAADAFLDIRGAPMIINLTEGAQGGTRRLLLENQIDANRARRGDQVTVIEDSLFDAAQQVQITLPSTAADLAAFQARREGAITPVVEEDTGPVAQSVTAGTTVTVDDGEGSWGEVLDGGDAGLQNVSYVETVIKNTTTEVAARGSTERAPLFRDQVVRLRGAKSLKEILTEQNVSTQEADRLLSALSRLSVADGGAVDRYAEIGAGGLVALRMARDRPGAEILQISLYAAEGYLASFAQPGPGRFERSADPWFEDRLLERAGRAVRARGNQGEVTLKDAVYATALRNGMPSELVGELMVMLSRGQDLNRIATEQDRLRVLIGEEARGIAPAGQILFASLTGPDIDFKCYVLRPRTPEAPFGCYVPETGGGSGGGGERPGALGAGFLMPVAGTKTSSFGPRHHPILNRTINHNGVDWAAPTGTPIHAVAAGRISRADRSPSYGNIIYIDHPGGAQSRYAHQHEFAPGIKRGATVSAGQLIGFVGTTGRSTGPHLHFELHLNGKPVDPLALAAPKASGAVEALVAQIIKVESAGNARAKNSRSSATGLGQFINSTWIRMMQTYRPDLVAKMSRAELLELRFDPALSRAMVTNLARENEAFLRARGHAITPGRLYLAHFLGPAGANTALRADANATVLAVMGAGVVNANPFLRGRTVGWMTSWADRKMGRISRTAVAAAPALPPAQTVEPAQVKRYKEGLNTLLASL
ncbi:M23 family metallopeptidase [Sulfitobacter albidus]|uniref:M23 family metallopeptidase n=1 Tax=Sulfitobacter albidus TaxID=2829501 RepID=A0A975JGH6_9RHOB|nr:M23 family metallopeptidase [Sulfitobacter albidus]QUJ78106.1 M23 family metallopeptidase [Sulfitobacter albidus]